VSLLILRDLLATLITAAVVAPFELLDAATAVALGGYGLVQEACRTIRRRKPGDLRL